MNRQPSHLPGLVRLIRQTLRPGSSSGAGYAGEGPGRRLAVDRREMTLEQKRIDRFLAATEGARIEALAEIVPPTYSATWETALALELLAASGEGLPLAGMIHLESELVQIRPLTRDDLVSGRVELDSAEQTTRGAVLTIRSRSWNGAGHLCTEGSTTLLLRSRKAGKTRTPRARPAPRDAANESWTELAKWEIRSDQGRRYARASGDFNPIHLWAITARPLGFPRPILQGFCTQALVAHALIEKLMRGQPSALRRLRIAFRAPLPLPSRPRLLVDVQRESAAGRFRVVDEQDDGKIFAEGDFVGACS